MCVCAYTFWRQSWFVSCCRCCDFHFKLSFKSIVSVMQFPVILRALFLFFHICVCIAISFRCMCRKEDQYIWFTSAFNSLHWGMWMCLCSRFSLCSTKCYTMQSLRDFGQFISFFVALLFLVRATACIYAVCHSFGHYFANNFYFSSCRMANAVLMWSARKTYMTTTTNKSQNYGHNCVRWFNDWKLDSDDGFLQQFLLLATLFDFVFLSHYFIPFRSIFHPCCVVAIG